LDISPNAVLSITVLSSREKGSANAHFVMLIISEHPYALIILTWLLGK